MVLYICYGNSCRSVLAEALTRHYRGRSIGAASAGLAPLGHITGNTLKVLEEIGVSVEGLRSKGLEAVDLASRPLVINLLDMEIRGFLPADFQGRVMDCYVRDPYGESLDSFRRARDTLIWLVTEKLPGWLDLSL